LVQAVITLRVVDQSGASGPYRMTGKSVLHLPDYVRVCRTDTGLALVEGLTRQHLFNKDGEYIGTEEL
jgi:hypothetical protein